MAVPMTPQAIDEAIAAIRSAGPTYIRQHVIVSARMRQKMIEMMSRSYRPSPPPSPEEIARREREQAEANRIAKIPFKIGLILVDHDGGSDEERAKVEGVYRVVGVVSPFDLRMNSFGKLVDAGVLEKMEFQEA